ncbi:MAG: acyltransferase [Lachnospiraceae bacterium]|nr:acyltransferase [Lachnospiraceae bacterium]
MKQRERNGGIDFLRFCACGGIIWLHYRTYTCPWGIYFGDRLVNDETSGIELKYLVELFFCISGYLCSQKADGIKAGTSFWNFMRPKLQRFIPMLVFGTLLCEALLVVIVNRGIILYETVSVPSLWAVLSSCFGVQEGWGFINTRINPESWFIDVLILCFALFYFSVWLSQKLGIDECTVFWGILLLGCAAVTAESSIPFITYMDGRGYESFFMGVLLGNHTHRNGLKKRDCCISAIILAGYLLFHVLWPHLLYFGRNNLMALLVSPAAIVLMETDTAKRMFSWKGFKTLGKIAFSAYIIHVCVIYAVFLLADLIGLEIGYDHECVAFVYMMIVFLIGALVYRYIEKPIVKRISG